MSMIVRHAFGDSLSDGDMKLPAALLITMLGSPNSATQASTAFSILDGSLTSPATGRTWSHCNIESVELLL